MIRRVRHPRRCEFEERTMLYLAQSLPTEAADEARQHIEGCSVCRGLCDESEGMQFQVAVAREQAERLSALRPEEVTPDCEEVLALAAGRKLAEVPYEELPTEHMEKCWLCSLMLLYDELRASLEEGRDLRLSDRLVHAAIAQPAEEALTLPWVIESREAELDRTAAQILAGPLRPVFADVLETCRRSSRWKRVAPGVRSFLGDTAKDCIEFVRTPEELKFLALIVAEFLAARVLGGAHARERHEARVVAVPRLVPQYAHLEGSPRAPARQITVPRHDRTVTEWAFLLFRVGGRTYVRGPQQAPPGLEWKPFDLPPEAQGLKWEGEAFITRRDAESIEELLNKREDEDPADVVRVRIFPGPEDEAARDESR